MINRYDVEDFDKYLRTINKYFNDAIMWRKLQEKFEYGSNRSEKGYQQVASLSAKDLARKLGHSEEKTELFVKILGSYFPQYGEEGKNCIREFLAENKIEISEPELASSFVENDLDNSGFMIASGLKEVLVELFDFEKNSGENEIELAKLYHVVTELLKSIYSHSREKYKEYMNHFDEELLTNIKQNGIYNYRKIVEKKVKLIKQNSEKMSESEKEEYKNKIYSYTKTFKDEGLYRFISLEITPSNQKQKQ